MDTDTRMRATADTLDTLPERLRTYLADRMQSGEEVLWIGQALARRVRYNAIWPTMGGLLLLAFWSPLPQALMNRIEQLRNATDSMFSAAEIGTLMSTVLLAGFCSLISMYALNLLMSLYTRPRQARYSACVVTSQRALIVRADGWRLVMSTQAFMPEQLQGAFVERVDGRCSNIVFRRDWLDSDEGGVYAKDTGFMYLADVAPAVQALRAIGSDVDETDAHPDRRAQPEIRPAARAPAGG